jgi:NAD(P)-dependent dehydrogenase (short-subunit alcohol dehydrogenase family)
MSTRLKGKRALVTGASSGIGKATAIALAREGAKVAVHGRNSDTVKPVIAEIAKTGGAAISAAADLRNPAEIQRMCEAAVQELGGIDILVSNAGIANMGNVVDYPLENWDEIMAVNLRAPFLVAKHALKPMLAAGRGGAIVFNASTNGKTADAGWTAYNASKHGLLGLMKCLAAEVGTNGVRVNAICPGWIETKMARELHEEMARAADEPYDKIYDNSMRFNMMKALIPPESVADSVVFLASDESRHITGQALNVCAGLCYF